MSAYADGGTGVPYLHSFDSGRRGPHALILGLTHGNELSGMIAVCRLLDTGVRPSAGRLSLCFVNIDAYQRFDPSRPLASRFVDRDMNRLWADDVIDADGDSSEAARAKEIRPTIRQADRLLDLHSVHHGDRPFFIMPDRPRPLALASAIGLPATRVILKPGGLLGPTIMDYSPFVEDCGTAAAVVAECGQHLRLGTAETATACALRFLIATGVVAEAQMASLMPPRTADPPADFEVTVDLFAETADWRYVRLFEGFDAVEEGEILAYDGDRPIRAPHADCVVLLARPNPKRRGEAMTLGRRVTREQAVAAGHAPSVRVMIGRRGERVD